MTPDVAAAGFRHFHDQLASLKETLLNMSAKAEERTDLAVEALMNRDRDKANLVIEGDIDLNTLEMEVEQAAVELLALQQPMARDLRFIVGAIKISNDLERVGDHAVNIAQAALRLISQRTDITPDPEIEDMARRAAVLDADVEALPSQHARTAQGVVVVEEFGRIVTDLRGAQAGLEHHDRSHLRIGWIQSFGMAHGGTYLHELLDGRLNLLV